MQSFLNLKNEIGSRLQDGLASLDDASAHDAPTGTSAEDRDRYFDQCMLIAGEPLSAQQALAKGYIPIHGDSRPTLSLNVRPQSSLLDLIVDYADDGRVQKTARLFIGESDREMLRIMRSPLIRGQKTAISSVFITPAGSAIVTA